MPATLIQEKGRQGPGETVEAPERTGRLRPGEGPAREICPECQAPLAHEGGCAACYACGYAKCG